MISRDNFHLFISFHSYSWIVKASGNRNIPDLSVYIYIHVRTNSHIHSHISRMNV